jgi:hypothetical protein
MPKVNLIDCDIDETLEDLDSVTESTKRLVESMFNKTKPTKQSFKFRPKKKEE